METVASAKRAPLYYAHARLNARMMEFAGWALPLQYSSILEEHRAVRSSAGLFDVSHLARLEVSDEDAPAFLNYMATSDINALAVHQGRYTLLCDEEGCIVDDLFVFRLEIDTYLLICNAANANKDYNWLLGHVGGWKVKIEDQTDATYMLAVQGPEAKTRLRSVVSTLDLSQLPPSSIAQTEAAGCSLLVSRAGYTGEDGFELIGPAEDAETVWDLLLETGVMPCGLGARDTLRLEAGLLLYGNDIEPTTNPYEAGLGWTVDLKKGDFHGKASLALIRQAGPVKRLVAFEMVGRGVPRHGYSVKKGRQVVGYVTSGGYSPTLDINLGLAYVSPELAVPGTDINIVIRGRPVAAKVVLRPFYRRPKA